MYSNDNTIGGIGAICVKLMNKEKRVTSYASKQLDKLM
jgi:hypothetical protein